MKYASEFISAYILAVSCDHTSEGSPNLDYTSDLLM